MVRAWINNIHLTIQIEQSIEFMITAKAAHKYTLSLGDNSVNLTATKGPGEYAAG